MAEDDREGDDLSGDEHSSGLQGEETEVRNQPHLSSGIPGEEEQGQVAMALPFGTDPVSFPAIHGCRYFAENEGILEEPFVNFRYDPHPV